MIASQRLRGASGCKESSGSPQHPRQHRSQLRLMGPQSSQPATGVLLGKSRIVREDRTTPCAVDPRACVAMSYLRLLASPTTKPATEPSNGTSA